MDKEHRLDDMGKGCSCKTFGCKKWKEWFPSPGNEKRCPRCWTLASVREEMDKQYYWCINCLLPV